MEWEKGENAGEKGTCPQSKVINQFQQSREDSVIDSWARGQAPSLLPVICKYVPNSLTGFCDRITGTIKGARRCHTDNPGSKMWERQSSSHSLRTLIEAALFVIVWHSPVLWRMCPQKTCVCACARVCILSTPVPLEDCKLPLKSHACRHVVGAQLVPRLHASRSGQLRRCWPSPDTGWPRGDVAILTRRVKRGRFEIISVDKQDWLSA